MASKKITELTDATLPLGGSEYIETVQGGVNKKAPASAFGVPLTREVNRAFSETLLFDKNEIEVEQHTMTDDLTFVISPSGNLANQVSSMVMEVVADGVHAINFTSTIGESFAYIYPAGIASGVILDAGTYEIYIWYQNGKARVNIPGVSAETSSLTQLTAPANFAVVADGENALDLSWDDVDNETEYQIEKSATGTGGWVLLSNPAADATSDTETGLSPGETVFYRIKAIGDGVTFSDSGYSTASGTTESSSDVTAPVPTFLPANGNSVWTVNKPLTITFNEDIRDSDGVTAITSANAADYITLKETNSGGADIGKTVTYDAGTRRFTITPTTSYGTNQLVYLAVHGIEDVNSNEMTTQSITFTTTEFTDFNGSSNRLAFGDILDSLFATNDTVFKLRITLNNFSLTGTRTLFAKWSTSDSQRSFILYSSGTDVKCIIAFNSGLTNGVTFTWAGVLTAGEHVLELTYDGSQDGSSGLDRCILKIDTVTQSKTLDSGFLSPGSIFNSTAQLSFGIGLSNGGTPHGVSYFLGEAKDLIIENGSAAEELNVPVLRLGTDTSGNGRNGVWV